MKDARIRQYRIRTLLRLVDSGIFAVPKLQREFVWNGRKAAALLDSIYRRMPIGSIFVWETDRRNQYLLRKELHLLPPFDEANRRVWFLIDGQQRLSVLHQARIGQPRSTPDPRELDFSRVVYRLAHPDNNTGRAFDYRRPVPGEYIPLRDIVSPAWRYKLRHLPQYKLARIAECRDRVLSYHVPIVFVDTKDLNEVRELFVRINSLGTPVGSADRVFARAATMDLRQKAHELKHGLPKEFQVIRYETILLAFALVAKPDLGDVGERAYESVVREWEQPIERDESKTDAFLRLWSAFAVAFQKAVDYLKTHFCVLSEDFLPSENMLATLSLFFYHNPAQPDGRQQRQIRAWFWATGVAQRYSGRGYRANILSDAHLFRRLARTGRARFLLPDRIDPDDVKRSDYSRRSSLTGVFMCLLAKHQPRYLGNGLPVPKGEYAARANRKNRHHIYPKTLLAASVVRQK
jgi:hypothetical protein